LVGPGDLPAKNKPLVELERDPIWALLSPVVVSPKSSALPVDCIVTYDIISDPELSTRAKSLYALLCCYADKDRICFPTKSKLADELNVSQKTIKRYLTELYNKNYIKRNGLKITVK